MFYLELEMLGVGQKDGLAGADAATSPTSVCGM